MPYQATFSDQFLKDTKRLDRSIRIELDKAIEKVLLDPYRGKPLRYAFRGLRRERVGMFRLIYRIKNHEVEFMAFKHRGEAY